MQDAGFKRFVEKSYNGNVWNSSIEIKTNGSGEKEKNIEVLEKVAV